MSKSIACIYGWFIILLLFPAGSVAQTFDQQPQVYPEKLHHDIDVLADLIRQVHPDPYRYVSKVDLDKVLKQVKDSVRVPQDMQRFMENILPIFHAVGDAHCIPILSGASARLLDSKVPLLPLKVRILEEGVFVEEELKGFRSIPNGSRVISINGIPMSAVIDKLCRVIVADGNNRTYKLRRIERELHLLYAMHVERTNSFTVLYVSPEGVEQEGIVFAMTGEEILRSRKPEGPALMPWRAQWEPQSGAMWVTMNTLSTEELAAAGQRPDKFLDAMLSGMQENKAQSLVIDLRGAGGIDHALVEQVFIAMAKQPFRVLKEITVRSTTPPEHYGLSIPLPEYYASLAGIVQERNDGHLTLHGSGTGQLRSPVPKAFQGKVYVVCDGYTTGSAAALVMLAKRSARAMIIGEETGTNAHAYTGGRKLVITLPNSGLQVHIPLERYVPDGTPAGPADRGEAPHHILLQDPRALASGKDAVKGSLLRTIKELQ